MRLGGPAGNRPVRSGKPKVFVTDGRDVALHGICLFFTRPDTTNEITEQSMIKVRYKGTMQRDNIKGQYKGII